jgi:hypothetical protein
MVCGERSHYYPEDGADTHFQNDVKLDVVTFQKTVIFIN